MEKQKSFWVALFSYLCIRSSYSGSLTQSILYELFLLFFNSVCFSVIIFTPYLAACSETWFSEGCVCGTVFRKSLEAV